MNGLCEEVAKLAETRGVFPEGSRMLVAVSGGVDSMVLLHVLHALAPTRHWRLVVAHLNHQLRGRSGDADARFVATQCERLGVPCVTGTCDVKSVVRRERLSIEMAARECRHGFLARTARQRRCPAIALAHHADDQAELVLLRLLRGSGSEGLGGMTRVGPSPADPAIRVVRPLLEVSRERILAFAKEEGIGFREDRSNASRRFLRNRVRHELLPLLRQHYQPAIDRILVRTASILASEADCIDDLASAWLRRPAGRFDRLPLAVRRRVLLRQALELGLPMDFDTCERLVGPTGRRVSGPGGETLVRAADGRLSRVRHPFLSHSGAAIRVALTGGGVARFGGCAFQWRVVRGGQMKRLRLRHGKEYFDADRVGEEIRLRHWQAGDRFQPIGMSAPVKLQDLFTNLKVPPGERRKRVVAEAESGEVFWVEGLRIGDRFKLGAKTRKRLIWRWNC